MQKIVNGKGNWMFYGHAHPNSGLASWYLLDLRAFRAGLMRHQKGGLPIRYGDKRNADSTACKWFDIRGFPAEPRLVVARG